MSLSEMEIAAIRASFAELRRDADGAAARFYAELFAIAPETRGMFRDDLSGQGAKLMGTLGVVVAHLHTLDTVLPTVRVLAVRHVDYGVRAAHYPLVGRALDRMLAVRLGPGSDAARNAWAKAFELLASVMIAAAASEEAAAEEAAA